MNIATVEIIAIRAPRKEAVRSGSGLTPVEASEFGIVRIVCDDGTDGVGEISITYPKIGFSLCHAARRLIAPRLIGRDPLRRPEILGLIDAILIGELSASFLRAAFEMALLDLAGRHYGLPVYQLLGGKARDGVPLAWGIYQKPPEEMAADAAKAVDAGFSSIKLKVGRELDIDIAAVRAVAIATGGTIPLRLDANMSWRTIPQAVTAIEALAAEAPIAWIEQPLRADNLDGMRLLRQRCRVAIMADESLRSLGDAFRIARAEAADVFNVYVSEAGGLVEAGCIFALGTSLGIPSIIGSQAELGIGTAAAAHLGVTVAELPFACETFGPMRYERDVVQVTPRIERGMLYPADAPGLGVALNWDAVQRWRVDE